MKVFSDKAVSAAQDEYEDALKHGVEGWFAMKLALDVAVETDRPKTKKKIEPHTPEDIGQYIVWFAIAAGLIIIFGMVMKRIL